MRLKILESSPENITYQSDDGIVLHAKPNELLSKNVLLLFANEDRACIRKFASDYLNPRYEYDFFWLGGLYGAYFVCLILSMSLAYISVPVMGTIQPGGILIFPLTFVILDSVNEIFQYRYARTLTFTATGLMLITSVLLYITLNVFDIKPLLYELFHKMMLLSLINVLSLTVADQTNNIVFRMLRYGLAGCPLWLRSIVSTISGQIVATIIFVTLYFGSSVNIHIIHRIVENYSFKIGYSACLLPITYMIVAIYRYKKK